MRKNVIKEFLDKGYIIEKVCSKKSLTLIKNYYSKIVKNELKKLDIKFKDNFDYFNDVHQILEQEKLNQFRLSIINQINLLPEFNNHFYKICKDYLNILIGDELAMQKKINLSIQMPKDHSSILPMHADTWDGDSPFEVVVWLPLVNCYKTKAMYILPANEIQNFNKTYKKKVKKNNLYNIFKSKIKWIKVNYGEVLIFNQCLPHGNIINKEKETRWSMNCRFKNLFTPYADKKLAEFFYPLNLKPVTKLGLNYKFPDEI